MKQLFFRGFWRLFPAGVLLLALGVRYYRLDEAPLWVDEIFSWIVAQMRPSLIVSYLYQGNNPPLWELILSGWLWLIEEDSSFSLRFWPATFSALTAVVLYYLSRETGGSGAGLLSALLWIFSTFAQGVCREARAYGLLAFLSALSFWFFVRYLRNRHARAYWGWLIVSILLLHTHYSSFFVPLFQSIWLLFCERQKALSVILRTGGLIALSWGPAAILFVSQALSYQKSGYAPGFSYESVYNILWAFSNMPVPTVMALGVWGVSLILLFVGLRERIILRAGKGRSVSELPLIGFPLLIGLMVGIAWKQPFWQARYFVPLAVLYFWAIGTAISLWPLALRVFLFLSLSTAWISTFNPVPYPPTPNIPDIARSISRKPPHHLLIVSPVYMVPAFAYPLRDQLFSGSRFPKLATDPLHSLSRELSYHFHLYGANRYADLSPCEISAQDTLFWLDMGICYVEKDNILETLLLEDFTPIAIRRFEKATLTTYRRRTNPPP